MVVDRAQGGASLKPGQVEVMVHRRILKDDARGVAQPLNETMCGCTQCHCPGLVARGTHHLTLQVPLYPPFFSCLNLSSQCELRTVQIRAFGFDCLVRSLLFIGSESGCSPPLERWEFGRDRGNNFLPVGLCLLVRCQCPCAELPTEHRLIHATHMMKCIVHAVDREVP